MATSGYPPDRRGRDLDNAFIEVKFAFLNIVGDLLDRLEKPLKKYKYIGDPVPATNSSDIATLQACKQTLNPFYEALSYLGYVSVFEAKEAEKIGDTGVAAQKNNIAILIHNLKTRFLRVMNRDVPEDYMLDQAIINTKDKDVYYLRKTFCDRAREAYLFFEDVPKGAYLTDSNPCLGLTRLEKLASNSRTGMDKINAKDQDAMLEGYRLNESRKGTIFQVSREVWTNAMQKLADELTYANLKRRLDALFERGDPRIGGGMAGGARRSRKSNKTGHRKTRKGHRKAAGKTKRNTRKH